MKITLCGVCHEELDEPETNDDNRIPCPVCGSKSRKYENETNFRRCKQCNALMDHVDFLDNQGLCYKCHPVSPTQDATVGN